MVFVTDPAHGPRLPQQRLVEAHGLTRAEARVALAAAQGSSVAEIAAQLQLSGKAVKTHLRRVYAKTGAARQAELTRIVMALEWSR
jgi:DNA-binding CsgD family transcriptional regulator